MIIFLAPQGLSTIHTCGYIQEHFRLAPFHACHGNGRIEWIPTPVNLDKGRRWGSVGRACGGQMTSVITFDEHG